MVSLALAVIPGRDNVMIIGNKTLRERLGIDIMAGLKRAALRGLGQNAEVSAEKVTIMATIAKEDLEVCVLSVRQVVVSMEDLRASQKVAVGLRK